MDGAMLPIIFAMFTTVFFAVSGWLPFGPLVGAVVLSLLIGAIIGLSKFVFDLEPPYPDAH